MFRKTGNPIIEELTKSHKERRFNLSELSVIKIDGVRKCVWCAEATLPTVRHKYCSKTCSDSAMAWANPQKDDGLNILIMRQDWKCNLCQYDWAPLAEKLWADMQKGFGAPKWIGNDFRTTPSWVLMRRLKSRSPNSTLPEVDHIIPISKGGQALGQDNHQAICYTCHKVKSKVDNSGPRKKKLVDKISK